MYESRAMIPPRLVDRMIAPAPHAVVLRCWYVRLMWPASLIILLIVSLPRITTLAGMIYLVVIDLTGILAGLQGASWIRQTHPTTHPQPANSTEPQILDMSPR